MLDRLKEKIIKFYNNKKLFWSVMGTIIFLVVGLIAFVIGAYASGWYVLEYLISPTAIVFYFIGLFVVIPIIVMVIIYIYCYKGKDKF